MTNRYTVGLARPADLEALPGIEMAAATLFPEEDLPPQRVSDTTPVSTFSEAQRQGRLWVALDEEERPVGFALGRWVDGNVHLEEIDVAPDHGRRGLGARLVEQVLSWARATDTRAVSLTTFEHLPWNAPFYRRMGFRVLDPGEIGPELSAICAEEASQGLRRRVAMVHPLECA